MQGSLFANCQECHLQVTDRTVILLPSCKRVDLLKFTNSVYRVKTLNMAVMTNNEADILCSGIAF